jgi:hypothetical protein
VSDLDPGNGPSRRRGVLAALLLAVLVTVVAGGTIAVESLFRGGGEPAVEAIDGFETTPPATSPTQAPDTDMPLGELVAFVNEDVQRLWQQQFAAAGGVYAGAGFNVFEQEVLTPCGPASAESGPFYCPADESVYLDLSFLEELGARFGAPGDFAQAYVIAHELAHHVQNRLGVLGQATAAQEADPASANDLSIMLELQADCLAGVWATSTYERGLLEPGDIEEGLAAAASVGDDRLQAESGRVLPETFTHGTSDDRMHWFRTGYETGDPDRCDTFSGEAF